MQMRPEKGNAPGGRSPEALDGTNQFGKDSTVGDSIQHSACKVIAAPFHGAQLYVVEHEGQPYTPMKPIVEGMGLSWQPQHRKLTANQARWGITDLVIPSGGGAQVMTCAPLRKLPGWMASVEVGKVKKPSVRERVIQYQNECDDALWKYWNDGVAVRRMPGDGGKQSTPHDRLPLYHFAIDTVIKHRLPFNKVYALVNLFAGVRRFKEMTKDQSSEAADFCLRFTEGRDTRNDWHRITDNQIRMHGAPRQLDMVQRLLLS